MASAATASAAPYTGLVVFGDSLSDVGNDTIVTGGTFPGPAYYQGRFSNGVNYVDDLAAKLGLPAPTPSVAGGTDYAYGGARTAGSDPAQRAVIHDVDQQLSSYLSTATPTASTPVRRLRRGQRRDRRRVRRHAGRRPGRRGDRRRQRRRDRQHALPARRPPVPRAEPAGRGADAGVQHQRRRLGRGQRADDGVRRRPGRRSGLAERVRPRSGPAHAGCRRPVRQHRGQARRLTASPT